ncbi:MAG: SsrA-binding protein SmpB [Acidimicrobiales bacterium]|nr:SsrA-binding protein SmpB [Acidimicrobiales bacterium]RZV44827.1 MAG: SsrA-binding protein SmpB [Acidimicrobiales bacterium]
MRQGYGRVDRYDRGVATKNANKRAKHGKKKPGGVGEGKVIVATNRRARRDFEILDTYECGMVLRGSEVKSLRDANVQLAEAYGRVDDGEMWLLGMNISPYAATGSASFGHVPDRHRKLLLRRSELDRIDARLQRENLALVALSVYFLNGRAKVEIGLARGKREFDRRQDIARRDADREAERAMSRANHGRR